MRKIVCGQAQPHQILPASVVIKKIPPVAGSYRAIDFALSSMANSRVQKVGVFTQYNAGSLNEHLSSSKWWDFGRKQGGLFV